MVVVGAIMSMMSGSLVYYHCAYRHSSVVSVPVDPLHWQISQDTATSLFACLANTLGAAESVLRVAAIGHDKRLFFRVVCCLYLLSVIGRAVTGVTVAYIGLCLFCLYMVVEESGQSNPYLARFSAGRRDAPISAKR